MGWETDLERSNDMDSVTSDSMEKFDDSFFDDFFDDSKDQGFESNVTEDDLAGLLFDDTPQEESDGAKVLKLTKGDMSVSHKDTGSDEEGMRALNEFYSEIANEIYENMKTISEDGNLSHLEKVERMAQEARKWEICKEEWKKDANGKK